MTAKRPPAAGYIRFSASAVLGSPDAPRSVRFGPSWWDALLDDIVDLCGATASFVVDAQGLAVASRGDIDPPAIEGAGARLLAALEQGDGMGALGPCHAVAFSLGERWLTGLRADRGDGHALVIGVLADGPLDRSAQRGIATRIAAG